MKDSALVEAFNSLGAWELRTFRTWLESPCFNRKASQIRLYDYLEACRNNQTPPDQHAAMAAVFEASEEKQVVKFRHEMSALLKLLRDFLVWQELSQTPVERDLVLLRSLRKRGLDKNFALALRESEAALAEEENQKAFSRSLFEFHLEVEKYQWALRVQRGQDFPFEQMTASLSAWYAGQLLQLACMQQSKAAHQGETKGRGMENWMESLLQRLPAQPQSNVPGVALYYHGYRMMTESGDSDQVVVFRQLLEENLAQLPHEEASNLLLLAINHGIRRINEGDRSALQSTLDFYLLGLEKKILQDEKGVLSKYTYNNVLMNYLALEEWNQAKHFLETYATQLPAKEQENIYRYNLAIYHFRQGNFDATLELLRNVNFPDTMYNLESRKMLLKIYFEQGAFDALESTLENLLTWLRRHGEIGYHREMYRNLARFTGRLLRLAPTDVEGRKRLGKKIRETPLVAERSWLLEKLQIK